MTDIVKKAPKVKKRPTEPTNGRKENPNMTKESKPNKQHSAEAQPQQAASTEEQIEKTAAEVLASGACEEKKAKSAESELDALKLELEEARDRALRSLAELENFRQRKNRELADDRKYADISLARDVLPVWDNMGRAIEAAEQDLNVETLIAGVKMMHQQFLDIFKKHHIERIEADENQIFDPNIHESIAMLPSDVEAGHIVAQTQAGFKLHDRVVRPAQVVLSAPKADVS